MSEFEGMALRTARGWLWAGSEEDSQPLPLPNSGYAICHRLALQLWQLALCVDVAGGGENSYWRFGNLMHSAGVYSYSADYPGAPLPSPLRRPYIYSFPTNEIREAAWSTDRLALADRVFETLQSAQGVTPRFGIAFNLRALMTSLDVWQLVPRFQLAVTALETFYIAPTERQYLWDPPIRERLLQVCKNIVAVHPDYFDALAQRRHDAVHRGGRPRSGDHAKSAWVERDTELILRHTLCWASINLPSVTAAFNADAWPA